MKTRNILFLTLSLVPFAQYGFAVPSLTSYSGTLNTGTEITLTGSGMGTGGAKVQARPLKYEDAESGSFISTWTTTNVLTIGNAAAEQRWSGSSRNINPNMISGPQRNSYFTETNTTHQKWFVQYWIKISTDFNFGTPCAEGYGCANQFFSNVKIFRLWDPGSGIENFYFSYDGQTDQLFVQFENISGENTHYAYQNAHNRFPNNKWFLMKFEFNDSSSLGSADASFHAWIDGASVYSADNDTSRTSESTFKRPFIIGFQDEWNSGANGDYAPNHFWMDDVVVDDDWTRFEISTCSNYGTGACGYEYQRLNSISDTSSKFLFSQGQLPNGAAVYGFWTDSSGNRNATGLAMTVGGSGASVTQLNPVITPNSVITSSIGINWTSAGSSNYTAVLSSNSAFTAIVTSGNVITAATSYINLASRASYYFEVKVATESDSAYSTSISTLTKFTELSPVLSGLTTGQLTVTWTAVAGKNVLPVLGKTSDFSSTFATGTLTTNTTTYSGLSASANYWFQVKVASETDNAYTTPAISTMTAAIPAGPSGGSGNSLNGASIQFSGTVTLKGTFTSIK